MPQELLEFKIGDASVCVGVLGVLASTPCRCMSTYLAVLLAGCLTWGLFPAALPFIC